MESPDQLGALLLVRGRVKDHLAILLLIEALSVSGCSISVHRAFYELTDLSYSKIADLDCTASFPDTGEVVRVNKRRCARTVHEGKGRKTPTTSK